MGTLQHIGNWNRCLDLADGDYVMILGDDDILKDNFLEDSVKILQKHPKIGFTFAHCDKVDQDGKRLMRWGYEFTPAGYLSGHDYLYYTLKHECCLTNSSTVLLNKKACLDVGKFGQEFGANTFDFNMWIKLALKYDVYFIDKVLADYRLHQKQVSEEHWRKPEIPTGKIGTYLELFKVISLLQDADYANGDKAMQQFLNLKSTVISKKLTELLIKVMPSL